MRTIVNIVIFIMVLATVGSAVFAQGSVSSQRPMRSLAGFESVRSAAGHRLTADKVDPVNAENFYIGYDLQAVRYYIAEGQSKEALTLLINLWNVVGNEDETRLIEDCAAMFKVTGSFKECSSEISGLEKSIESRLTGEKRWYYDVGKNYSLMFIVVAAPDGDAEQEFRKQLDTLGKLAASAPDGTPAGFVTALAELGGYATKDLDSHAAVVAIEGLFDEIDNAVNA